ncbi:MAG: YhcH/YjgK/YiaL family protein [Clostridia bacterium]|nr:YhcH/YjgK/YiaL family protein [Clostridia bacterium]
MIFDKLENTGAYMGISDGIDKALEFLKKTDIMSLPLGKIAVDGDKIYAVCMEYETKPLGDSRTEAHGKYIDVQYIASGSERMYTAHTGDLSVTVAYDDDKDVMFLENRNTCGFLAGEGSFAIFFPHDAHMPGVDPDEFHSMVRKVVVKVHV